MSTKSLVPSPPTMRIFPPAALVVIVPLSVNVLGPCTVKVKLLFDDIVTLLPMLIRLPVKNEAGPDRLKVAVPDVENEIPLLPVNVILPGAVSEAVPLLGKVTPIEPPPTL